MWIFSSPLNFHPILVASVDNTCWNYYIGIWWFFQFWKLISRHSLNKGFFSYIYLCTEVSLLTHSFPLNSMCQINYSHYSFWYQIVPNLARERIFKPPSAFMTCFLAQDVSGTLYISCPHPGYFRWQYFGGNQFLGASCLTHIHTYVNFNHFL